MTITEPGTGTPQILLRLGASPEAVAPVRHCVAAIGESLGLGSERVANLKTIVSEACTNVVVHAYNGTAGPLEIAVLFDDSFLEVRVRDFGRGIAPIAETSSDTLRLGLSLIAALADRFEVHGSRGEGTEVRARLHRTTDGSPEPGDGARPSPPELLGGEIRALLARDDANSSALASLVSASAVQADLPIDRLEEATLVAEALAQAAFDAATDAQLQVGIVAAEGGIRLRLGPLVAGSAEQLLADLSLPQIESTLTNLADSVAIEPLDPEGTEMLEITFMR